MTSFTTYPSRPHASVRNAAATLWASIVHEWRSRQADLAMQNLSDEMLHDIGVSRGEIEDVTRHGRRAIRRPAR